MPKRICDRCRSRLSSTNPHTRCDRCIEFAGGVPCNPESTCDECRHFTAEQWELLRLARLKRARDERHKRSKSLPPIAGSAELSHDGSSSTAVLSEVESVGVGDSLPVSQSSFPPPSGVPSSRARSKKKSSVNGSTSSPVSAKSKRRSSSRTAPVPDGSAAEGSTAKESTQIPSDGSQGSARTEAPRHKRTKKSTPLHSPSIASPETLSQDQSLPTESRPTTAEGSTTIVSTQISSLASTNASTATVSQNTTVGRQPIGSPVDNSPPKGSTQASPSRGKHTSSSISRKGKGHLHSLPVQTVEERLFDQFRTYLKVQGLEITPQTEAEESVVGTVTSGLDSDSDSASSRFGEEDFGPSPAKISRTHKGRTSSPRRKVIRRESPLQSVSDKVAARAVKAAVRPSSHSSSSRRSESSRVPPSRTEPSRSHRERLDEDRPRHDRSDRDRTGRDHRQEQDNILEYDPNEADEFVEAENSDERIEWLSQIWAPQDRLVFVAQVLGLDSPGKGNDSKEFKSSLQDDLRSPKLLLPHSDMVSSVPERLDDTFSKLASYGSGAAFSILKTGDTATPPLPFHNLAHAIDEDIHLLCPPNEVKRYAVSDSALMLMDSNIRRSLRHLSVVDQVVRALNKVTEEKKMERVAIRSLGETLFYSVGCLIDHTAWSIGAICHMRRKGILARRDRAWSDTEATKLLRAPWDHKELFAGRLREMVNNRANESVNLLAMASFAAARVAPSSFAQPNFTVKKSLKRFLSSAPRGRVSFRGVPSPRGQARGRGRGGRVYTGTRRSPSAPAAASYRNSKPERSHRR